MKILVTGGAGFIGSHLVDSLVELGHRVKVLDNLELQVHGNEGKPPEYLNRECEFIKADMRNRDELKQSLKGVEIVFHLAATVGVAQSMYQIGKYAGANVLGTASLLDILANESHQVEKMVVASSMSVYGEGKYRCHSCGVVSPKLRLPHQLRERDWEMKCPFCGKDVEAMPTDEEKSLYPTSVYAISKRDQEEMCLTVGRAYRLPTVALRYFNVYGSRQALSNPYTGVAAIFSCRILNNNAPHIFEDGGQSRDFIHVSDIVRANLLAMEKEEANYQVFNVGTGRPKTVLEIADILIKKLHAPLTPKIVNKYRQGDIRHCYADISKIQKKLGFKPEVKFEDGISELVDWLRGEEALDQFEKSRWELEEKGLTT